MLKIINARQVHELDTQTVRAQGITTGQLMERAAEAVAEFIIRRWPADTPIVAFAGPGGNGGDALVATRILAEREYNVTAYLFNISGQLSEDCSAARDALQQCDNVNFTEVKDRFEPPRLTAETLVVDGLFGIGLNKNLSGGFASLVRFINDSEACVISIDMPSGLMCEDNRYNVHAHIIRADHTLTFQLPKLAQLLADNNAYVGRLHRLDIGLESQAIEAMPEDMAILEENDIRALLNPRPTFAHKGTFGHALIIAGRYGMAGAAILAARSCLRGGVGKVTIHTPQMNNNVLQTAVPEAILSHDESDECFTTPVVSDPYDAIAIGPGLGTSHATALAFIEQVRHSRVPLVIDADGINILSEHKGWIQQIPPHSVLTPHPGEFRRLGIRSTDSYSTLDEAREMATRYNLFIILKGHNTAILTPEGQIWFNPTGNQGMATAGTGDTLTGLITALLAAKYSTAAACKIAVYLHGMAGDIAADTVGSDSLTASDLIDALPAAFKRLRQNKPKSTDLYSL